MSRSCSTCGRSFRPRGEWQKLCWPCWHRTNDVKQEPPRERVVVVRVPALDETLIRDCIRLAHPDVHPPERFELANRTTAALLELLRGARRAA